MSTEEEQYLSDWTNNVINSLPLTPEEEEAIKTKAINIALHEARKKKGHDRFMSVYSKMAMSEKKYPEFDANKLRDFVLEAGRLRALERHWKKGFVVDPDNKKIIRVLSMYFTDDPRFETLNEEFSLHKGILLIGDTGCGKTQLMELFSQNPKLCYTRHDCVEITRDFSAEEGGGVDVIRRYIPNRRSVNLDQSLGQPFFGRFFDDFGAEGMGKHFGNSTNVMEQIIQERYKQNRFWETHFTTNLTLPEIENMYGKRAHDRILEMCNVIEFGKTETRRHGKSS